MPVLVDHQLLELTTGSQPTLSFDDGLNAADYVSIASIDVPMKPKFYSVSAEPCLQNEETIEEWFLEHYRGNSYDLRANHEPFFRLSNGENYLFEAAVELTLPPTLQGLCNPKSSSGRNALHCKQLCNGHSMFDVVPFGYQGRLFVFVRPRIFPVRWQETETLIQLRLVDGDRYFLRQYELEHLHRNFQLLEENQTPTFIKSGLVLHLSLEGSPKIGVAQKMGRTLPLTERGSQRPHLYFIDKEADGRGIVHLEPGDFALAHTIENVRIPPGYCAEMSAIDPQYGDIRWHDAGFIDPGFGYGQNGEVNGATIVCEISNFGPAPIQLRHGRPIGVLRFEKVAATPAAIYGATKASHYQGQRGITFAKQFRCWEESRQPS